MRQKAHIIIKIDHQTIPANVRYWSRLSNGSMDWGYFRESAQEYYPAVGIRTAKALSRVWPGQYRVVAYLSGATVYDSQVTS